MNNIPLASARARHIAAGEMKHISQLCILNRGNAERGLRYCKDVQPGDVQEEVTVLNSMLKALEATFSESSPATSIEVRFGTSSRLSRVVIDDPAMHARHFGGSLYDTIEIFAAVMIDNAARSVEHPDSPRAVQREDSAGGDCAEP